MHSLTHMTNYKKETIKFPLAYLYKKTVFNRPISSIDNFLSLLVL